MAGYSPPLPGFSLHLGRGLGWLLLATGEARPWLENLARTMELKPGGPGNFPKLIFAQRRAAVPRNGRPDLLPFDLPHRGWRTQELWSTQLWSHPDVPDLVCEWLPGRGPELDVERIWSFLHPIYRQAQDQGGFPFHGGLVERNGRGFLLGGQRDMGKSTCCRRLPPPWRALGDEETLIVRDHRQRYLAHPFPTWSEHLRSSSRRTWPVQKHVPVSAVFFLKKAARDEVLQLGQGEAAVSIYRLALHKYVAGWRSEDTGEEKAIRKKLFENACGIARAIPAYILRVSLMGHFWEEMEKVLARRGAL